MSFKVGDVVQLKSGGPDMTVSRIDMSDKNTLYCAWFGGRKLEHGNFKFEMLVAVESTPKIG